MKVDSQKQLDSVFKHGVMIMKDTSKVQLVAHALLLLSSYLLVFQARAELSGEQLFNSAEEGIKALASSLGAAYDTPCPPSCNCSQDLCQPLPTTSNAICFPSEHDSNLYSCKDLLANDGVPSDCASVKVTDTTSSVNYVRVDENGNVALKQNPENTQMSAVCRTQQLDSVFQFISRKFGTYYVDYYVGTIDGSVRTFPGREDQTDKCGAFDSRKRPFYNGGISYPHHLVILIDRGRAMGEDATFPAGSSSGSRLENAQKFASSLMETVYVDSYVNVFTFGGGGGTLPRNQSSKKVAFNYTDPQNHLELQPLKTQIMSTIINDTDTVPADFVEALNVSFGAFDAVSESLALNIIIIIFTDGGFTETIDYSDASTAAVINQVKSRAKLFIYGINPAASDAGLQLLSNRTDGYYRNIETPDFSDPLVSMGTYFGYLAASHKNIYGDAPFWIRNYKDFFSIGNIATVAMPAFNTNNTFVGVAGIDITLDELGPSKGSNKVRDDFEKAVTNRRSNQTQLTQPAPVAADIPNAFDESSCLNSGPDPLLCAPGNKSGKPYQQRCCDCSVSSPSPPPSPSPSPKPHSNSNHRELGMIIGSVLGPLLAVAALVLTVVLWRKYKRRVIKTKEMGPQQQDGERTKPITTTNEEEDPRPVFG